MSRLLGAVFVTSLPATTMRPWSGRSKPATSRSAVVLPQPDGPRSDRNSPSPSEMSIPFSALTVPKSRWRFWSSRYPISAPSARSSEDTPRAAALASHEQEREHGEPREAEAHQRQRRRGVGLRLVDVLQEDRERVERREVRDRELAEHDRERQEGRADRRRPDVREDDLEQRRRPARSEALRRLRQRVDVDRPESGVEREERVGEREDHVGGGQEPPRLRVEPVRRSLVDLQQPDDHDDR